MYNSLTSEDKIRFQWQVWDKHLASPSLEDSGFLWNRLYGHKRFMVNARPLLEKDRHLFEDVNYLLQDMVLPMDVQKKQPQIPPIMHLRSRFEEAEAVMVDKFISKIRYHLHESIEVGQKFLVDRKQYGVCSLWGIPVRISIPGWEKGTYELPLRQLVPIDKLFLSN